MHPSLLLSLHPKATLISNNQQVTGVQAHHTVLTIQNPTNGIRRILKSLAQRPGTQDQLEKEMVRIDGPAALADFYYCIRKLELLGAICYTVANSSEHMITFIPRSTNYKITEETFDATREYRLSRFAYFRRNGNQMVLESPLSPASAVILCPSAIAILMSVIKPRKPEEVSREFRRLGKRCIETLLTLLLRYLFLEDAESADLLQWEFHDLLFHKSSRLGPTSESFGGTFRFRGKIDPLAALKLPPPGDSIELPKPTRRVLKENKPFFTVLEQRKSIRVFDDQNPINIQQLGEFLYRVARVKEFYPENPVEASLYELTSRPYPAGGACYELELYLVIRLCKGIDPGLYFYDPQHHRIHKISMPSQKTDRLLQDACKATREDVPQVLICIAARFGRVFWKYEAMAYAMILKDVGVLYQTMYLVATAMGLAPCALGAGDSDLFAQAAATDYYVETSVGEFILGSKIRNRKTKDKLE